MRFGLFTGTTGISWPQLQSLWQHLEATGWDAACVTDHFMPNTRNPVDDTLECWTALSGLALSTRSEEHTSELQSLTNLVCRLLLEKKKKITRKRRYIRSDQKNYTQSY